MDSRTQAVLATLGLLDDVDQFEALLVNLDADSDYQLALAAVGVLMLKSGLKPAAVALAMKRVYKNPGPKAFAVLNGSLLMVPEGDFGYARFDLNTLAEVGELDYAPCTTMLFNLDNVWARVRNALKE